MQRHTTSPTKTKFKQPLSARKIMCTVFWDHYGVLLIDYCPNGQTINAQVYCDTLQRFSRAIQNKRRGLLSSGVVLLHDNASPHTARLTTALLQQFRWEIMDHPPVQSGPRAERLPSVSAHEAFSRWKGTPFRCRGGNDSKQLVATTGGRLFRHRHSKICDAIQQVPRFCWWLRRTVVFRIA